MTTQALRQAKEALIKGYKDGIYTPKQFAEALDALVSLATVSDARPVAFANWKVGSKSYVPFRTREEAEASVRRSEVSATQNGPYAVAELYASAAPDVRPSPDLEGHRIMTREEYDALKLKGWHQVCHGMDSAGSTAIRYGSPDVRPSVPEQQIDQYARDLAMNVWRAHYRDDSPYFGLLDTTLGVLSQLDNMVSGLARAPSAAPVQGVSEKMVPEWALQSQIDISNDLRAQLEAAWDASVASQPAAPVQQGRLAAQPQEAGQARNAALEEAARRIEGGSFLHDQAPTALFAKEAAAAVRRLKSAQAAPAVPEGLHALLNEIASFQELNEHNYSHGDVAEINNWGVMVWERGEELRKAIAAAPAAPAQEGGA